MSPNLAEKIIYFFSDILRLVTFFIYGFVILALFLFIELNSDISYNRHWVEMIRTLDNACITIASITFAAIIAIILIKGIAESKKGLVWIGLLSLGSVTTGLFSILFSYEEKLFSNSKLLLFVTMAFSIANICGLYIYLNWRDHYFRDNPTQGLKPTMPDYGIRERCGKTFMVIGFLIFIIVYIIWLVLTISQHSTDSTYVTTAILAVPSFFLAVVTFLYVLLTQDLVKINQDLVNAQSQPSMIAHVKENDIDIHYIDLIFENVGMGIARNVHFDVEPHGFITTSGDPLETLPVIQNGIPALGPKQKFRMVLCHLPSLIPQDATLSEIHDNLKFRITITYQNSIGDSKEPELYDLDMGIFWGLRYIQSPSSPSSNMHVRNLTLTTEDVTHASREL
jgi:hypothetical protein